MPGTRIVPSVERNLGKVMLALVRPPLTGKNASSFAEAAIERIDMCKIRKAKQTLKSSR